MKYLIVGYNRSGTSMLMYALKCAGISIQYDKKFTEIVESHYNTGKYRNNPTGFYEAGIECLRPLDEHLLKVDQRTLYMVPLSYEYNVIYIERDNEEIIYSLDKMYNTVHPSKKLKIIEKQKKRMKEYLKSHKNFSIVSEINYTDLVNNPIKYFATLDLGIEIDANIAANAINSHYYRNKKARI